MNAFSKTILGAIALGLALPAFAATHASLPAAKSEGNVTYLSGGIGKDEALAMKRAEKDYPLSMVFSEGKHNEYVADVRVTIKDKTGKTVLNTVSNGPIMLARLPAGTYSVTAEMGGKAQHRTAKVSDKGDVMESFHWPHA